MGKTPQEIELEELRKAEEAAGREVPEDLGRAEEEEEREEEAEETEEEEASEEEAAGEEEETGEAGEAEEEEQAAAGEEEEDEGAPGDPKVAIREKNRQIAEFKKERKEYETKLQEMQTRYEQRLEEMLKMHAGPKKDEGAPEEPFNPAQLDWEGDPVGSLQKSQEYNHKVSEEIAARQQQIEMHSQLQQFSNDVNNAGVREYGENWDAATIHLKQVIYDTVRDQGGSEQVAKAEADRQVSQIALGAAENRRSPHEVLYKTAERFGFKPAEAAAGNGDGAPKPPPKKKDKKSPSQLEQIRRAKEAAAGSGGSGGGRQAPSGIPTPQEVFNMTPEEFAAFNADAKKVEAYHRKHG